MDELTQQIQARLAELPLDVRQAVESAGLDSHVQTIGNKHQLHIDQTGKLQNETLLVMLGFTSTSDFVGNLAAHVGVPAEKASAIAADINNEIFGPIRESLKKISGQAPAQAAAAPSIAPKPPAPAMPAAAAPKPTVPAPSTPPVTIKPPPSMPPPMPQAPAAKPQVPLAPHPHDLMLVEKTVTTPATPPKSPAPAAPAPASATPAPPKPDNYKSDPYREPVEP